MKASAVNCGPPSALSCSETPCISDKMVAEYVLESMALNA